MAGKPTALAKPKYDLAKLPGDFSPVGYHMPQDLTHDRWHDVGEKLASIQGAVMWWVGDWLAFGAKREWGKTYDEAMELFGYEYNTLVKAACTSRSVELCSRLHNLSWAHHFEVAKLSPGEQTKWLNRAASKDWTSKQLRTYIREAVHAAYLERQDADTRPTVTLASWESWLADQEPCDLLLTDPPYSTDVEDISAFANAWLPAALAKMKPTGRAYVFIGAYPAELACYLSIAQPEQVLVWTYRNTMGPTPTHNYKLNWQAILYYVGKDAPPLGCPILNEIWTVQDIATPQIRHHAWQKPDQLAERLIRHATETGDRVLDPFVGTGTFVLAAAHLGRIGKGCDISKEHIELARKRGCAVAQ